ncbi:MAG: hypothetical protein KDA80_14255 [Planctomycetaceae bacterium]|nr:hypothetical protein [Planctomycetaceae bacterium]
MNQKTTPKNSTPWGLYAGLLSGCGITLLTVVFRHEPETVLFRSLAGAALISLVVSAVTRVWTVTFAEEEDL